MFYYASERVCLPVQMPTMTDVTRRRALLIGDALYSLSLLAVGSAQLYGTETTNGSGHAFTFIRVDAVSECLKYIGRLKQITGPYTEALRPYFGQLFAVDPSIPVKWGTLSDRESELPRTRAHEPLESLVGEQWLLNDAYPYLGQPSACSVATDAL